MGLDQDDLSPEERSKRLLARLGNPLAPTASLKPHFDPDLVPEADERVKSPEQQRLDAVLDKIDIVDAYRKLIGKSEPGAYGNRTEGIKVSCPMPNHPDTRPSAWINTEKQVWNCGGCHIGGDVYDLAAIHFGYDLATYKSKADFPVLRKQLAETFGYTILRGVQGEQVVSSEPEVQVVPPAPVESTSDVVATGLPGPMAQVVPARPLASVTPISAKSVMAEEADEKRDLVIEWQTIFPESTYGYEWMRACTIDDLPHEFYFGLALQALGFAAGHNNLLVDFQDVKANLFVCLYGRTGLGKSRSLRPYLRLLEEVFPFQSDPTQLPEGVRILPTPGSGESVIDAFHWDVLDPATNKVSGQAPISGLLRHEELSGLVSKASRSGSTIKEVLIEMYDVHGGDVTSMTRTSGVKTAHNPFCQMVSTTQPNAIHAFLRRVDIESGFLNRWLMMAGVPRIAPIPYGGVTQDIDIPIQKLKDAYVWARSGHRFVLQGDALDVWTEFFNRELAPYKSGEVAQESIFSRVDLTLKKIVIAMTINETLDQPTGDLMERVLMLYPYLQATYSMFSQDITFNDVTDCQHRILRMIERCEEREESPPTKRDFVRALQKRFDGETIVRALRNLLDLSLIDEKASPANQRGRPTIRYALSAD